MANLHHTISKEFIAYKAQNFIKNYILPKPKYNPYEALIIEDNSGRKVKFSKNAADQCEVFSLFLEENPTASIIVLPVSHTILEKCSRFLSTTKHFDSSDVGLDFEGSNIDELQELYLACDFLGVPLKIQEKFLARILTILPNNFELDHTIISHIIKKKEQFILGCIQGYCRSKIRTKEYGSFSFLNDGIKWQKREEYCALNISYQEFTFRVFIKLNKIHISISEEDYGKIYRGYIRNKNARWIALAHEDNAFALYLAYSEPSKVINKTQITKYKCIMFEYADCLNDALEAEMDDDAFRKTLKYFKYKQSCRTGNNGLHTYYV